MDDMEIEVDASMSSWIMDSFGPDGQQNVQQREAETLERVRNMVGDQVTVESVDHSVPLDPSFPPDPNLAGHLRPVHTLRLNQFDDSSQAELDFNSQPGVSSRGAGPSRRASSSRGAGSAAVRPPRNLQSLRGGPEGMSLVMGSKVILLTPDGGPL